MKILKLKIIISLLIIIICSSAFAQSNISFKLSTFALQAELDENAPMYKLNLSKNGKWLVEPGLIISTEVFPSFRIASVKLIQGLYLDRMAKIGGFTHLGLNRRILKSWKHSLNFGLGLAICYRKSWREIDNYQEDKRYIKAENEWQYAYQWLSFEIEYDYILNKKSDLSISLNTIHLNTFSVAVGWRYWMSKKRRKRKGSCNCPQF